MSKKKKDEDVGSVSSTPPPEPAESTSTEPPAPEEYSEGEYVRQPSDRKRPADLPGRRY